MAGVAGDQHQVHLAAGVGHQVVAEHAEEAAEEQDQDHADAEGVEQPAFLADQHRIDQVLDEVGRGDAEDGHEDGAEHGLGEQPAVAGE